MKVFALTYTDPSEPWGVAVEGRKLYRTPSAVCDAANAHFDAWQARILYKDADDTLRDYYAKELSGPCAANYRYYDQETGEVVRPMTVDEVLARAWDDEFGFITYDLED